MEVEPFTFKPNRLDLAELISGTDDPFDSYISWLILEGSGSRTVQLFLHDMGANNFNQSLRMAHGLKAQQIVDFTEQFWLPSRLLTCASYHLVSLFKFNNI